MQVLEGIFYTNLTEDLTQFIAEIKKKEIIDEYTAFVIFYDNTYQMVCHKYWKSLGCIILDINHSDDDDIICSNEKYLHKDTENIKFDDFKQLCDEWDLLEKHIKFAYNIDGTHRYKLDDNNYFNFWAYSAYDGPCVLFKGTTFTINEFINKILTNYPEFYNYDYSQIKPVISANHS